MPTYNCPSVCHSVCHYKHRLGFTQRGAGKLSQITKVGTKDEKSIQKY